MSIEIGKVDEATRQDALRTLMEHAADPSEPGAWIAETARHLLEEGSPTPPRVVVGRFA